MKKEPNEYAAPQIEAIRVELECGYSDSVGVPGVDVNDWNDGGLLDGGVAE